MIVIWIPFNVPSSKNGKIKTRWGITDSKAVKLWRKNTKEYWEKYRDQFAHLVNTNPMPIFVHLTFVRKGGALFDYVGPTETIMDEMVKYQWINDDNAYQIVPIFGKFRIDKDNPGVEIRILKEKPQYEFL